MKNTRIIKSVFIPSVVALIIGGFAGSFILGCVGFFGMMAGVEVKDANGVTW